MTTWTVDFGEAQGVPWIEISDEDFARWIEEAQ